MKRTRIESKGLGDTVQKFTTATGMAKAAGKDCGCGKRKDTLNRMFPYDKK